MKFLICPASETQVEYGNDQDLFKGTDGGSYNYQIEFDKEDETIRISDTIGRMIPIDVTELGAFIMIFSKINQFVSNTESVNKYLYEKLIQGANQ